GEPEVPQRDIRLYGLGLDGEGERVAERPVAVGEGMEQVRVLVVRCSGQDVPGAGEDAHCGDRLVRQAAAEAGRLDAKTGDGPAEGDGLELRDDQRHDAVGEELVDQLLVCREPADHGRSGSVVGRLGHFEDAGELGQVEPAGGGVAWPEQVGRLLGQAHPLHRADVRLRTRDGAVKVCRTGGHGLILPQSPTGATPFRRWRGEPPAMTLGYYSVDWAQEGAMTA